MSDKDTISIPLRGADGNVRAMALIDAEDASLAEFRWCLSDGYVARNRSGAEGRGLRLLHRDVLGLGRFADDPIEVDHINGDKLNCRRSNLRLVTHKQNHENRPSRRGSRSRYRGVLWNRECRKWQARVRHNGKQVHLGLYAVEEDAAAAARDYRLANFPRTVEERHPVGRAT